MILTCAEHLGRVTVALDVPVINPTRTVEASQPLLNVVPVDDFSPGLRPAAVEFVPLDAHGLGTK